jgi:putative hemolysin
MKINLRAAFQAKNPGLARWIPSWLFKILERLIHQDEINTFLAETGHLRDLPFAREVLRYFGVKVAVRGLEHLPVQGPFVLVANHPLGGLDGLAMYDVIGQVRDRFASLSNDIMMQVQPLEGLFIPVNKHGRQSKENLAILQDKIASGYGIIIFPSGLVSRRHDGAIGDLAWKKTAITIARKNQIPLVPLFIEGRLSERFYKTYTWRKRLGIKANIEMILLPDEMYRLRGSQVTLHLGAPVLPDRLANGEGDQVWTQRLRDLVYSLAPTKPTNPSYADPH